MDEILKETKTNVIERQILLNQIAIMGCLKFNNLMFREVLDEGIKTTTECIKALDEYAKVVK